MMPPELLQIRSRLFIVPRCDREYHHEQEYYLQDSAGRRHIESSLKIQCPEQQSDRTFPVHPGALSKACDGGKKSRGIRKLFTFLLNSQNFQPGGRHGSLRASSSGSATSSKWIIVVSWIYDHNHIIKSHLTSEIVISM